MGRCEGAQRPERCVRAQRTLQRTRGGPCACLVFASVYSFIHRLLG